MTLQLTQLQKRIDECEHHLESLVKKHFTELYNQLLTIPSIGPKTVLELIIITDGFKRFTDVKELCAYVGVSPTTFRSGSSVMGKGALLKWDKGVSGNYFTYAVGPPEALIQLVSIYINVWRQQVNLLR